MKISVIIPTYKPQSYIWECLDSICNQTYPKEEYEVIIVLNGCKEPYDGQIREYINNHPDVQWNYIQTDQGGVSNARNIALDVAKGEYVAFIDDDDYVSPSYLEELYAKSDDMTIAVSNSFAFNDGNPEELLTYEMTSAFNTYSPNGRMSSSKVRRFFSGPCMKLISMSFIQGRRFDVRFKNGEDSLFMFLISDKYKYVDFTSSNAIYFRRYREGSAVTSQKSIGYVVSNCCKRWAYTSRIYFGAPYRYSFRRYVMSLLGPMHIIMVDIWDRIGTIIKK